MEEKVDPMKHIYELSVNIGPRRPGSDNEKRASDYIYSFFKSIGLDPMKQQFLTISTFSWPYIVIFGLYLLSFILQLFGHLYYAVLIAFLSLIVFILEGNYKPVIYHILPKKMSHNVYAIIKPTNEAKNRLILSAHYDSSRAAWFFNPRYVKHFRTLFLAIAFSAIIYPLLLLTEIFLLYYTTYYHFIMFIFNSLSVFLQLFIILGFVSMIHRELFHKDVPGANDNASGVGVLLSLAEIFSKQPLKNTEIWLVATGSEESGMFGIINFLKSHQDIFDKKNTFIINFDNLGTGNVHYITGEGLITTLKSDPMLIKFAEKANDEKKLGVRPKVYKLLPTDATPAIAYGYRAMSIMSFDNNGLLPNWHWYSDIYENVEEETVKKALTLAYEIIQKIDKIEK
ncbi:MAG: M28 family metallopeptidase [Candidatus Asgardarchaeia archaeon]